MTKICDDFWEDFMLTAKLLYMLNPEATIYDVFNHIRVEENGGHNNYGKHWRDDERTESKAGGGQSSSTP